MGSASVEAKQDVKPRDICFQHEYNKKATSSHFPHQLLEFPPSGIDSDLGRPDRSSSRSGRSSELFLPETPPPLEVGPAEPHPCGTPRPGMSGKGDLRLLRSSSAESPRHSMPRAFSRRFPFMIPSLAGSYLDKYRERIPHGYG